MSSVMHEGGARRPPAAAALLNFARQAGTSVLEAVVLALSLSVLVLAAWAVTVVVNALMG